MPLLLWGGKRGGGVCSTLGWATSVVFPFPFLSLPSEREKREQGTLQFWIFGCLGLDGYKIGQTMLISQWEQIVCPLELSRKKFNTEFRDPEKTTVPLTNPLLLPLPLPMFSLSVWVGGCVFGFCAFWPSRRYIAVARCTVPTYIAHRMYTTYTYT